MTTDLVERLLADMREVMTRASVEADEGGFEGLTSPEWEAALGLSNRALRRHFRQLLDRGMLDVGKVRRPTIDGRLCLTPAYRPRLIETEQQG